MSPQFFPRHPKYKFKCGYRDNVMDKSFCRRIKFAILLLAAAVAISQGITMDCKYYTSTHGILSTSAYTCQATIETIDNSGDPDTITAVTGNHSQGMTNANVGLKTITSADLQPFPNLVIININQNLLRELDGDLFKYNPYLRYIYLSNNAIERVGLGFLDGLEDLTGVQFVGNR